MTASPAADTEGELLVRCQRYEAEALADLFDRFHDQVHSFLAARTGDAGLSEELTRETFSRALGLIGGHRNRGAGLGPWLLRVANGRLLARRGATGPRPAGPPPPPLPAAGPEAGPDRLRAALDLLPAQEQEVLALRFIANLPLPVVARALHKGTAATSSRQVRGLKALNRHLSAGEAPPALEPTQWR